MEQLKPCPFCGMTPVLEVNQHKNKRVACHNESCKTNPETQWCSREHYAVKRWNTRAERTTGVHGYGDMSGSDMPCNYCNDCNGEVPVGSNYCPDCGLKVVR